VELVRVNVGLAERLARLWELKETTIAPGVYDLKDGIKYLLALWATFCRGSRFFAEHYTEEVKG
jgi:hypothetical protein